MSNLFLPLFGTLFLVSACTITFQNISTNGKAEDVVDDKIKTDPEVDTSLDIPEDFV